MRADRRIVLALGVLLAGPASAYSLIGWDWDWQSAPMSTPFKINVSGFPSSIGTTTQVTDALRGGQDLWGDEGGADFSFNYGGTTTQTSWSGDGTLISQYSSQTVSGGTLAVSQSWGWSGDMTDCDQRYYARNAYGPIRWSADPAGAGWNELDLEFVAAHEYGHCAGLDHSSNSNAVMYASATAGTGPSWRHLHNDDKNGLQAMYGVGSGGGGLVLEVNGAVIAGASHTFTITGADPGEVVHLLTSVNGVGAGPCPPILGGGSICLDIRNPIVKVGQATVNGAGTANVTVTIPSIWAGWTIGYQAGVLRGPGNGDSILSNAEGVQTAVAGASCPAGTSLDCSGDCWDSTWVGDGYCDDGTMYAWGDADFDCAAYSFDAGDCP